VDHEGGVVHRFAPDVGRLPPPLSYWEQAQDVADGSREKALDAVETAAYESGQEIRGLGITLNLAPVVEVLTDTNQAFLEDRSYGPDGEFVKAASAAFIRGMERAGIICVVKHFPGNTGDDPHSTAITRGGDRDSLNRLIEPMAALLAVPRPPMVMVSHALVPAWDGDRSASLSPAVIGLWLREELGFTGVILADDFSMAGAVTAGLSPEAAAVEALIAGVDMVITWPRTLTALYRTILAALDDGRLSRERLQEAAARILYEKIRAGLIETGGDTTPPTPKGDPRE
jgi:beta-N-acetylhexosaminidase